MLLTYRIPCALLRAVSLFRFARVISFSANRWASLALCHVVWMDSFLTSDVTRLRSSACRCAEVRPRCLNLVNPPAIFVYCVAAQQRQQQRRCQFSRFGLVVVVELMVELRGSTIGPEFFVLAIGRARSARQTEPLTDQGTYLFRRHISQWSPKPRAHTSYLQVSISSYDSKPADPATKEHFALEYHLKSRY